jgi:hypothetical protein
MSHLFLAVEKLLENSFVIAENVGIKILNVIAYYSIFISTIISVFLLVSIFFILIAAVTHFML